MSYVAIVVALAGLVSAATTLLPNDAPGASFAGAALAFGFLLLAAFCMGRIFAGVRLPKIVAYLATGMLAGPYVLDLVSEQMVDLLQPVNGVAVCLIALSAGGELDLKKLAPLLRVIRRITLLTVLGPSLVLFCVLLALRPLLPFLHDLDIGAACAVAAMLGVALAAKSPAVTMALIEETRADGPLTRTVLGVVVLGDLAVMLLYTVASTAAQSALGGSADLADTALGIAWELFGSMGFGVVVGMLLWFHLRKVRNGLPMFVLLICIVVSEVGRRVHLDPLILMLAAGVFLENATGASAQKLIRDIESASLPVYLVFFAVAGASIHLDLLVVLGLPAAIVVGARAVSFFVSARLATRGKEVEPVVAKWVWAGLLPQAGLALALAILIRRSFPGIGEHISALCFAVVAINELVMPVLMRHALVASGEAGRRDAPEFGEPESARASNPPAAQG